MSQIVTKEDLKEALERQTLLITNRLGGLLAAGIAIIAAVVGFLVRTH